MGIIFICSFIEQFFYILCVFFFTIMMIRVLFKCLDVYLNYCDPYITAFLQGFLSNFNCLIDVLIYFLSR